MQAVQRYQASHGVTKKGQKKPTIGGDKLDITTWTPAERAEYSFTSKDLSGKKEREATQGREWYWS